MSNVHEVFAALKEYLINNISHAKSTLGGKQVAMRCHICGDSMNQSSRHLYVGIMPNADVIVYHCFRCNASGMVTGRFLRDVDIYDIDMAQALNEVNKRSAVYSYNTNIRRMLKSYTPIIWAERNPQNDAKLAYIERRIGPGIGYDNLAQYKIIPDLKTYMNDNSIRWNPDWGPIHALNDFFIGFLSSDNSYVTLRNLVYDKGKSVGYPELDKRHYVYNLYNRVENAGKYYVIPGSVDPAKRIEVHMAEGALDILSVKKNLIPDRPNTFMCSVQGKSYVPAFRYMLERFGFIDMEFHLYPDGDMKQWELGKCIKLLKGLPMPIYLHRNQGEKDFGVPPDRIHEMIDVVRRVPY
ncbi:hypothetical protein [uncultured Duncaniella sp.]|uniref:hypothetical protein n=1 Tax=uncultured Duncaniella sp. TaxID=2768039 RepID=UPI00260FB598|nr:hypothetical protein [uncultured Duncaniella sp.]